MSSHKPKQLHLFCRTEDEQVKAEPDAHFLNGNNCNNGHGRKHSTAHLRSIGGNPAMPRYVPPNPIIEQVAVARWAIHDALEESERNPLTEEEHNKILSDLAHMLRDAEKLMIKPKIDEL